MYIYKRKRLDSKGQSNYFKENDLTMEIYVQYMKQ